MEEWYAKWWVWLIVVLVLAGIVVGILFAVGVLEVKAKPVGKTFQMTGQPSSGATGSNYETKGTFSDVGNGVYTATTPVTFDMPLGTETVSVSAIIWSKLQTEVQDGRYRVDVDFGSTHTGDQVDFWVVGSTSGTPVTALNTQTLAVSKVDITNGTQVLVPAMDISGGQAFVALIRWGTTAPLPLTAAYLGLTNTIPEVLPVKSVNFVALSS
jgi:hypothetical protein